MPNCSKREALLKSGRLSPSQRAATNGRTIASSDDSSFGAGASRHSSTPFFMNVSCCNGPPATYLKIGRASTSPCSARRKLDCVLPFVVSLNHVLAFFCDSFLTLPLKGG